MKKYLAVSIIFVLFTLFMGIQTFFKFLPELSLGGVEKKENISQFSSSSWFSKKFQQSLDSFVDQRIAFKGAIVRTYNQLNYNIFKENNAGGTRIVVGKDNWLFQQTAIDFGIYESCTDTNALTREINTLRDFYNKLKTYRKNIIFLGGPNKVDIYPEYVKDKYMKHKKPAKDTYDVLMERIQKEVGIPVIDGRKFLLNLKEEGIKNLFPQGGAHWSVYAASLILEELLQMTGYTEAPIIQYTTSPPHFMDTDLVKLMNIWTYKIFTGPELKYPVDSSCNLNVKHKPSILFIGDSACHILAYAAVHSELFSDVKLVYYNSSLITHYKDKPKSKIKIEKNSPNVFQFYRKLLNYDIIVLSMSEQHMTFPQRMLSYGFPNFVVELFKKNPDFMTE